MNAQQPPHGYPDPNLTDPNLQASLDALAASQAQAQAQAQYYAQAHAEAQAQLYAQAHADAMAQAQGYANAMTQQAQQYAQPLPTAPTQAYAPHNQPLPTAPMQAQAQPLPTIPLQNPQYGQPPAPAPTDHAYAGHYYQEEQREEPVAAAPLGRNKALIDEHLRSSKRKSAISALILALLGTILIALILYLIKSLQIDSHIPTLVTYHAYSDDTEELSLNKVKVTTSRRPSAPSASTSARTIASTAPSDVSVPVPQVDVDSFGFGQDDFGDFGDYGDGDGWGSGSGGGNGGGGDAGGFGSAGGSGLKGHLYDFKQNRDREPNTKYLNGGRRSTTPLSRFVKNVGEIHKAKFSESSLKPYFKSPQELTLTHLAIATRPASDGPRYFEAAQDVQPKGWIAHYSGKVVVPESGSYRFSGMADDYLSLFIDDKPALHACWPEVQTGLVGRWNAHRDSGKWLSPIGGQNLVFGRWISLRKGQILDLDLGIGERPGGKLAFLLMVEKKGVTYEIEPGTKRPILPIFTTAPFSKEQEAKIINFFPNFRFEWNQVPIFTPASSSKPGVATL